MSTAPARLLEDGRVTIPADIRREKGLEPGDYVVIDVEPFREEQKGGGP